MSLLSTGKIKPDDLSKEIANFTVFFSPYYPNQTVDQEILLRKILADYGVFAGDAKVIEDNDDHQEWLAAERSKITWLFWDRYKKYLEFTKKLPKPAVDSIDHASDEVLKRIESPKRAGTWDRRGMVVGNVQSGKTANYIALINKAADAGYKFFIVLAGLNNDLRSQTQKRIDQGFLGRDTQKKANYNQTSSRIGVGMWPNCHEKSVLALTSAARNGDFKKNVHNTITLSPGGEPTIAVIKKNVTPLKNLLNVFQSANSSGKINNVPLLLIDDEADNASIDTKAAKRIGLSAADIAEQDPTRINGLIRKILNCFTQSAYVGYTATPFANIFIYPSDPDNTSKEFGEDLYPRSFIVNLHAPSNYLGPEKVFGLSQDQIADIEEVKPLPLIREADDYETIFPKKHKNTLAVTALPDSMILAVYAFILSSAARYARGQGDENQSMLIHVTRFVKVQTQLTDLLTEFMHKTVRQLELTTGPQYQQLITALEKMWEEDFMPTTEAVIKTGLDRTITVLPWAVIQKNLFICASKIEVKAVNGKAADGGINYDTYPTGCTVIAVGGDKLSRGLTLEGLSVSYYARLSNMYDTLLQMGRWFGYHSGYVDLCRLYTSRDMIKNYRHIAVANVELRRELDDMADLGATPQNYGLKVRTHPDGMLITALNKMRNSQNRTVTYAGKLVQVTQYYKKDIRNQENITFTDTWLKSLGPANKQPSAETHNNYIWNNVKPNKIMEFLREITIHSSCFTANPKVVGRYIQTQNKENELTNWTVALISVKNDIKKVIGGLTIGLTWRTDQDNNDDKDAVYLIRNNLITETDQEVDLSKAERNKALSDTQKHFKPSRKMKKMPIVPSPIWIRKNRKNTNGLLLIYVFQSGKVVDKKREPYSDLYLGYAISFPDSDTAKPVDYKVDEVYVENEFNDEY